MLKDKVAIVTGASRGLGALTARHLALAGAQVVLAARSSGDIRRIADEIVADGGKALALPCNVADFSDVDALVKATTGTFGQVDVLINNAGVIDPISFLAESTPQEWSAALDINLNGPYYGMRAVMPGMLERGAGTIITIGSGAAQNPLDGWSAYCSAKAGALMLTRAAHQETAAQGLVHINFSPGIIATDMQRRIRESGVNPVSQMTPDSLGDPVIPARILVWLCGPNGANFAGQALRAADPELRKKAGINYTKGSRH